MKKLLIGKTLFLLLLLLGFSKVNSDDIMQIDDFFHFTIDENNIAYLQVSLKNHTEETLYFVLRDIGFDSNLEKSELGIQLFFNNSLELYENNKVYGDFKNATFVELPSKEYGYISSFRLIIKTRFKNQNVKDFEYVWLKFHYFTKSSLSIENLNNIDCNTLKKVDNSYRFNLGWMKNSHVLYRDNLNQIDYNDSAIKTLYIKTKVRIVDYDLTK